MASPEEDGVEHVREEGVAEDDEENADHHGGGGRLPDGDRVIASTEAAPASGQGDDDCENDAFENAFETCR